MIDNTWLFRAYQVFPDIFTDIRAQFNHTMSVNYVTELLIMSSNVVQVKYLSGFYLLTPQGAPIALKLLINVNRRGVDGSNHRCVRRRTLQETIQFVFSHEQEGLLAIGTFALDQLAGVRNSLDGRPRKPSQSNLRRNSVPNVPLVDREVRSSEDEAESCQSASRDPLPACASSTTITRKDLPVFGDHDASFGVVSVGHAARNYLQLFSSVGRDIPAVLLQAAIDPRKEVETQLESRPGKQLHVGTSPTDDHSDEETFSQRRCGVVLSRWRTSKSDIKSKRKKPPEKQLDNVDRELHMRADGKNRASRGIKRLWRSGCSLCVTAKVAPVKKQNFLTAEREFRKQGPPCIANVDSGATSTSSTPNSSPLPHCPQKEPNQAADLTGELSRRRGASLGKGWACNHNGKWIRTDSEFVVLEM
ncbi:uncharacterized protein [Physcomitrium patens]|uniref:uncharacterized protein isoform X2 n=1 Tax=Physcomitrium patens TaxID=3218 RepID=UPI003CCC9099